MNNSNNFINNCKHTNSQKIAERYSNIAVDFKELKEKLSADSNLFNISNGRARNKDGKFIDVVYAHFFNNSEELENITFYINGGASIGTKENRLSFKWRKHLNTEELQKRTKDAYYYGDNVEQKVGYDVNFLNKDANTQTLLQDIINKYHLKNVEFKNWGKHIHENWNTMKKTHKNEYTMNDCYKDLKNEASKRKIAIVSKKYLLHLHKNKYTILIKMYCAKARNNNKKFSKYLKMYKEESVYLIPRIENPQIRRRGLWYKIHHDLFNGEWTVCYLPSVESKATIEGFNKSQIPYVEYFNLKDVVYKSKNSELKKNFLESYKNIRNMKVKEVKFLNDVYKKIILNNKELFEIWRFTKIIHKIKENKSNDISLNSFNRAFHSSDRPYFMKTKDGKLRRYESYDKYEKARKHFKVA